MSLTPQELADKYDLPIEIAELGSANLNYGNAHFLTISGKIGAGKDTVAPLVLDAMNIPESNREHDFFAKPLKEEINKVLEIIRGSSSVESAISMTMQILDVPIENAVQTVDYLWEDVKSGSVQSSYDRTKNVRSALQYWGTDVRRTQDDKYWIKKALSKVFVLLAEGKSVYITDSRFPNEVNAVVESGGTTIRLLVSPEVQEKRIMGRDGIQITAEARNHVSETALDDYTDFHVIVDTDTADSIEVAREIVRKMNADG